MCFELAGVVYSMGFVFLSQAGGVALNPPDSCRLDGRPVRAGLREGAPEGAGAWTTGASQRGALKTKSYNTSQRIGT